MTVVDNAGIVRDAAPADVPPPAGHAGGTSVEPVPGQDDAVVVRWMGGECDEWAVLRIDETGERFRATVQTSTSAMSCSAVGVLRAVRLSLMPGVEAGALQAP